MMAKVRLPHMFADACLLLTGNLCHPKLTENPSLTLSHNSMSTLNYQNDVDSVVDDVT
jgi:hypothetical protein